MTKLQNQGGGLPRGPWTNRVAYARTAPVAFRPNQLIVRTKGSTEPRAISSALEKLIDQSVELVDELDGYVLLQTQEPFDVEDALVELAEEGFEVEANLVYFGHAVGCGGCGCATGCGGLYGNPFTGSPFTGSPFTGSPFTGSPFTGSPFTGSPFTGSPFTGSPFTGSPFTGSPFTGSPFTGSPFTGSPFTGSPFTGSPFTGSPFTGSPFTGSPFTGSGARPSSARPADAPDSQPPVIFPKEEVTAIILDTGIARDGDQLPDLLQRPLHQSVDPIDNEEPDQDAPGQPADGHLDPIAGHGTFIAGIIEQLIPNQNVHVRRVLTNYGDGDGWDIAAELQKLRLVDEVIDDKTIINMSFGSYGGADVGIVASEIRRAQRLGAVVVASAGNDSTCTPTYPAAQRDVVGVASVEATGKAHYSNWGCWVRACAPGTDLTSAFFKDFEGKGAPVANGGDPDNFASWAQWTGTSFAGPVVAAALMRHMATNKTTAKEAMAAVIDEPSLLRYPGLGTVVNLAPS